jgi:hypothetical protein
MSKFANSFLKSLNEDVEGNAFTAGLAKTKKGGTFKLGKKKIKDTSNYDDASVKKEDVEGNAFTAGLAKTKKGGTFKLGNKTIKDTSNYDSSVKKEGDSKLLLGKSKIAEKKKTMKEAAGDEMNTPDAAAIDAPDIEDSEAWKRSLDKGTNPEDFDVADNPQHDIDTSGIKAAHEWVKKLVTMAEFVNGTGSESLNSQINQLEIKNSIPFRGVVRREEKRITKLAENLRGLAEVLKSVIITSEKKVKDATSPR